MIKSCALLFCQYTAEGNRHQAGSTLSTCIDVPTRVWARLHTEISLLRFIGVNRSCEHFMYRKRYELSVYPPAPVLPKCWCSRLRLTSFIGTIDMAKDVSV